MPPAEVWRIVFSTVSYYLGAVMEQIGQQGQIVQAAKQSWITWLYKKGSGERPEHYRNIGGLDYILGPCW